MAINFITQHIKFDLQQKMAVKNWIKAVIESKNKKLGELSFVFTSDEELLKVNQQYLNHNTFTDIITFDNSSKNLVNGDIIISVDRVYENSNKFKVEAEEEMRRVIIHGVLHLLGFKDKKKSDAEQMRKAENRALNLFYNLNNK